MFVYMLFSYTLLPIATECLLDVIVYQIFLMCYYSLLVSP